MKFKKIKVYLTIFFLSLTGILYSCDFNKDEDIISVEDSSTDDLAIELDQEGVATSDSDKEGLSTSDGIDGLLIEEPPSETTKFIYVHISGAVNNPGVYEAIESTRVYELIKLAGGLSDDAAGDYINQAASLMDGEQVYIPTNKELEDLQVSIPLDLAKGSSNLQEDSKSNKVNINIASKDELMTLTGIGEAKASSIIDYREKHGRFNRIEDIMNISGIKEAAFNKISEFITVD